MGSGDSEQLAEDPLAWHQLDPARFEVERRAFKEPWRLVTDGDGRYAWEGGHLQSRFRDRKTAKCPVRLIYPYGYPARFIEARITPEPPTELWGAYDAHVNIDGSACFVTAEGWTPQDTAREALRLLGDWWWNYYWILIKEVAQSWPQRGRLEL